MTLSFDASVVNVIPEPASNVNVSFVESAATLLCPLTAIVPNALSPVAEFVIVSVSVPGVVVSVIPVPAANVNVSVVESASIFVCPETAILSNAFPPAVPQLKFPEPSVLSA